MSKTRVYTKRYYLPFQGNYNVTNFPGGSSDSPIEQSVAGITQSTVTVGENLPNYLRLIRLGQNATTSMDGVVTKITPLKWGKFLIFWKYVPDFESTNWYTRSGNISGLPTVFPVVSTSNPVFISSKTAEDLALARFNEKVAAVNRQFQGGVFMAELAKTLHGLAHPAQALFKGLERYHIAAIKLRKNTIRRFLKDRSLGVTGSVLDVRKLNSTQLRLATKEFNKAAAGLWLEHSFHWIPLMYDIKGAWSALEATWERLPSEFVKASAFDEQSRIAEESQSTNGILILNRKCVSRSYAAVRMYGRVRISTRVSNWPDSKALGYDVRSFLPTIWELVPYSWAVDYFTNIGSIIYGLSYGGQDVLWCARGIKRCEERRHSAALSGQPPIPPSLHHTVQLNEMSVTSEVLAERAIISRSTYTGNYIPLFEWSIPGFSLKWLNLGAAFLQRAI